MPSYDPIKQALDAVIKASEHQGELGAFARELRPLLDAANRQEGVRRPARRDVGEIEYAVERSSEGESLIERRMSGRSKPFRCPKVVYDALVRVLSKSDRPMALDDILSATEMKLGFRPAEFQIRVPLRLWLYRHPPLVVRNRARYAPIDANRLSNDAAELWKKITK